MTKLTRQQAIDESVRRVYKMWNSHKYCKVTPKRFEQIALDVQGYFSITWWVREEFRQIMASR